MALEAPFHLELIVTLDANGPLYLQKSLRSKKQNKKLVMLFNKYAQKLPTEKIYFRFDKILNLRSQTKIYSFLIYELASIKSYFPELI